MEVTQDEGRMGSKKGNPEPYVKESGYWAFGKFTVIRTGWRIAKRLYLREICCDEHCAG